VRDAASALRKLRPVQARVDLSRLEANYAALAAVSSVPLMPIVKADGYGHGAKWIARCLEALGAPLLGVAFPEEGAALRKAGVKIPILILAGFEPDQTVLLLEYELTPVVSSASTERAVLLAARSIGRAIGVHIKVDTGMTRLGFATAQIPAVVDRLLQGGVVEVQGLMTHLSSADEDAAVTIAQLDLFDAVVEDLAQRGVRPRWIHAANSAGMAYMRKTHTLARPGLLLYGLRPRGFEMPVTVKPVMSLVGHLGPVRTVPFGTRVSYGGAWTALRTSRIATIPMGYADGVPRLQGRLQVRGNRVPLAGRVCMDLLMADITDYPEVAEGEEAVVFGDDPTASEVAEWAQTNAWQILVGVGPRVPRVYLREGRIVDIASCYLKSPEPDGAPDTDLFGVSRGEA